MSQTVVQEQSRALVGQKADLIPDEVLSLASEGRVNHGRYVVLGTDKDLQAKVPALTGDITSILTKRGVSLQSHNIENKQDGLVPGTEDKKPLSVMVKGTVYVESEQAVIPTDGVFVRFADGQGGAGATDEKGIFRKDVDTASAVSLPGARWLKSSELIDGKNVALLQLGVA